MNALKELHAGLLTVKVYETRKEMGKRAAEETSAILRRLLREKEVVNMVFAAAPSQNEFLEELIKTDIEWGRVNAFHLDEYIGLGDAPQSFVNFLKEKIFNKVYFKNTYLMNGNVENPEDECHRYADLLKQYPIDLVCMGIGENGHIAFNDPHIALFNDPEIVKIVELDMACKMQQVNDGCFSSIDDVPNHAITLTIPAIMSARYIFCIVPGKNKASAVAKTLCGEITESCPASILKTHSNAVMYLDTESFSEFKN